MSIKSIINQCIELNIKLSVVKENLKVDAPKGSMTKELLTAIKNNKQPLLDFLAENISTTKRKCAVFGSKPNVVFGQRLTIQ
ncbi:MAG: hypothetical protein MJK04_23445 [Psychrosphaera sp.]|nr:hypothetical protein [Psychrosphaera sp.]